MRVARSVLWIALSEPAMLTLFDPEWVTEIPAHLGERQQAVGVGDGDGIGHARLRAGLGQGHAADWRGVRLADDLRRRAGEDRRPVTAGRAQQGWISSANPAPGVLVTIVSVTCTVNYRSRG